MSCIFKNFRFVSGAASVLAVTVFCSQASAIPVGTAFFKKAQTNAVKAQAQASGNQLKEALNVLGSVHHTLKNADHDYGGHKGSAVHAIHAAEHQLRLVLEHHHKHHAKTGTKVKGSGTGTVGNTEPQALSDKQLAAAIPVLNATAVVISQAPHDFGGHRTKAIKDIQHAISELQTALKFSAVNNADKP
jgi:hypothetical protein